MGFGLVTPGNMFSLLSKPLQNLGSPSCLEQLSAVNLCCVFGWKQLWTLSHHLLITHHKFNYVKCLALLHGLGIKGSSVLQTAWAPARTEPDKCWRSLKCCWSQPFCQRESCSTIRVFYVFSFGTRSVIELASILLVPRVLVKTVSPVEMSGENIVDYVLIVFWFTDCFRQKWCKCLGWSSWGCHSDLC